MVSLTALISGCGALLSGGPVGAGVRMPSPRMLSPAEEAAKQAAADGQPEAGADGEAAPAPSALRVSPPPEPLAAGLGSARSGSSQAGRAESA